MVLDRKEEHLAAGNRPDSWNRVKVGYKKDGTVTAVDYESFGTAGVATGTGTGSFVKSAYGFPAVKVAESDVFTHLGPGCAMRAPGHPQGCFAVETALERSPRPRDGPARRAPQERSVRGAARRVGGRREGDRLVAPRRDHEGEQGRRGRGTPLRRGLGCAAAVWYTFVRKGSQVLVRIHRDGAVEVENGVQDIGGGIRTPIALVIAEELGLPVGPSRQDRRLALPYGPASGGSDDDGLPHPRRPCAAVPRRARSSSRSRPRSSARAGRVKLEGGAFLANGKRGRLREGLLADARRDARRDGRPREGLRRGRSAALRRAVRRGRRGRRDRRRKP